MPRSKESPKKAAPAKKQATPSPPKDSKKGPGLLAQAASTGAGAAVGGAVGHAVGHKLASGGNKAGQGGVLCDGEWKAFVVCSEKNSDQIQCKELLKNFTDCLKTHNKIE